MSFSTFRWNQKNLFTENGVYYYVCTSHANMVGKITVSSCSGDSSGGGGGGSVDLSSSTCADTNNADLCSGRDGSLNLIRVSLV